MEHVVELVTVERVGVEAAEGDTDPTADVARRIDARMSHP